MGLRGYAQRDPLVEYKLEGYNLFLEMMASIRRNTIYNVYMFQPAKVHAACHCIFQKLSCFEHRGCNPTVLMQPDCGSMLMLT